MGRVFLAYFSLTGNTQTMAEDIAEGIRMIGHEAVTQKVQDIKSITELRGFDGYIFGSPTHNRDIAEQMKDFLLLPKKTEMSGKLAGSFGSYALSGDAPRLIYENMQNVLGMDMFDLGPFRLEENLVGTQEGRKTCHDYGKVFGENLCVGN